MNIKILNITTGLDKLSDLLQCFSKAGSLIEFAGEKGSGKTSLLHMICARNTLQNKKTLYIDGSGGFRPEIIHDYLEKSSNLYNKELIIQYLKNIKYFRIYEPDSIFSVLPRVRLMDIDCIVVDDVILLCLQSLRSKMRFKVRKFVRDMTIMALIKRINIIFTNTIISRYETLDKEPISYELFYNDLVRYVHVKSMLCNINKNIIDCKFIYPKRLNNITLHIGYTRSFTQ
jgi:RecA/RadA recombinase